jgi:hypothetical protein
MPDIRFDIDVSGLDLGDEALDLFLGGLRDSYEDSQPLTTEEIMQWLLTNPASWPMSEHMVYLALVCATAMQRLTIP